MLTHNELPACNIELDPGYITIYINIFQKVSFCVITHLIGRNDRSVCKDMICHGDAFNVAWRIAPRAQDRQGRPRPHQARASQASIESTFEQSENVAITLASWATESSKVRGSVLLNCSLTYLFKETSTIASTLERSEERHSGPPQDRVHKLDYVTEPLAKREAR